MSPKASDVQNLKNGLEVTLLAEQIKYKMYQLV